VRQDRAAITQADLAEHSLRRGACGGRATRATVPSVERCRDGCSRLCL
jgi:hypothetical protein